MWLHVNVIQVKLIMCEGGQRRFVYGGMWGDISSLQLTLRPVYVFADHSHSSLSLQIFGCHMLLTFCELLQILAPSPPTALWLMVLVKYRATVKVHRSFQQNSFQCDGARWHLPAQVVPACRVAMDTYLLYQKHSGPLPTRKEPVPKLIYQWLQTFKTTFKFDCLGNKN